MKKYHEKTLEVHAGEMPDPVTGARATPCKSNSDLSYKLICI